MAEWLIEGKFYLDKHISAPLWHGPMHKCQDHPETWIDQWGAIYEPDGRQVNHVPQSAGNLDLASEADADLGPPNPQLRQDFVEALNGCIEDFSKDPGISWDEAIEVMEAKIAEMRAELRRNA